MQEIPNNITARVIEILAGEPARPFIGDGHVDFDRETFLRRVAGRQQQLASHGVGVGTRVLVVGERGIEFFIDLTALWGLGAVAVPFTPTMPEKHFRYLADKLAPAKLLSGSMPVPSMPGLSIIDTLAEESTAPIIIATDDPLHTAAILFTSGTTGTPKGVVLSHKSLAGNALAALEVIEMASNDHLLISIPFHFTSAICHFLATAFTGARLTAIPSKLLKTDLYQALKDRAATCFGGAPLQLRWIAECAAAAPITLRWVMSSGDRLSADVIHQYGEVLPKTRVVTFYGLTELGGRFCALPSRFIPDAAGSVGLPIPGLSFKILDENFKPVAPGQEGEIYADGEYVFDGYFQDPDATARALTHHGMKTGDLGKLGDDGFLRLTSRADDVFKSSGQKVSTISIMEELMLTGAFDDVAVEPTDHPAAGKVPFVLYVPKANGAYDHGQVMRTLRDRLPANHMPKGFAEVAEIPRTASGKIIRREVRQLIDQMNSARPSG